MPESNLRPDFPMFYESDMPVNEVPALLATGRDRSWLSVLVFWLMCIDLGLIAGVFVRYG